MHTIRRGVLAAGAPAACVSSSGSASETPAARRKVRRGRFIREFRRGFHHRGTENTEQRNAVCRSFPYFTAWVSLCSLCLCGEHVLFAQKHLALHDLVN